MTSSRWSCARSGVLKSTFFRSLKSCAGSLTGVPRGSLATEGAREVEARDSCGVGRAEVPRGRGLAEVGVPGTGVAAARVGPGGGAAVPVRLCAMMFVSSASNFSRSASATAWGDVKVKLWPASSLTRPTLRRTCAAPTLLRERASEGGGQRCQRRVAGRVPPLTRSLAVRDLDGRCFVSSLGPLEMRRSELEEAGEFFVGRLSGADGGRHGQPGRHSHNR